MARFLAVFLLPALFNQAFCLQCNTCHGEYNCIGENVTCENPSASCTTSVRKAYVSFLEFQSVRKGCAQQLYPPESISIKSHLMSLSYQARFCAEDGCNNETYFVSHLPPANHMRCHTCASQGAWCPEIARTQISCSGDQDQCVDLTILGKLGQYSNVKMKGCASLKRCEDTLSFYSGRRTIHASCCNSPLCNTFSTDFHVLSEAPNGLECYSCVDDDGSGSRCSTQAMSKVQCTGIHSMCLEGVGNSRKAGRDLGLVTFKGCASPAMCQSSLLGLVQELDNTDVLCCQGSLCNNRIVNGKVTEARIPADSMDIEEAPACIKPSPAPSGVTPIPDCAYTEEKEDDSVVSVHPSAGIHIEKGTDVNERENNEKLVTENNTMSHFSHHDDDSITHKDTINENISEGSSQGNATSPSGVPESDLITGDGSSATTNLDKSNPGASTASSGNHGNVVVLIPVVVSRRNNTTTSSTTSSSTEATTGNRILGGSNANDEIDDEECETEVEGMTTGEHFMAAKESNHDGSTSTPRSTIVPVGAHSDAGIFVEGTNQDASAYHSSSNQGDHGAGVFTREGSAQVPATDSAGSYVDRGHNVHAHGRDDERFTVDANHTPRPGHSTVDNHGATSGENFFGGSPPPQPGHVSDIVIPIPFVVSKDNDSFITKDNNVANTNSPVSTSGPDRDMLVSGAGVGTARPKNKVPCKRPGSQRRPGAKLESSDATNKRISEDIFTRDGATSLFRDTKNSSHSGGGKDNPNSGSFSLLSNLSLFLLSLLMVALLH
ncbi:papilin-like [Anolis sagrei]|uniref:papilin-like n=1 Tax=Anolis sagrei TaxID=38937 RepID=UPI003521C284